ncbi:mucosa-associated lymphoid tissue lymphoma translocation protein 1 homolog isoform X1 [Acropora millepora]|uniref:mucosa-associated lymphoid tissue lymphoma translocation protein 1 homolog isoform X1 n=1 Tax=Acropora millepora TaxID=45264 RepID=UPI001CF3D852|nr:mucosa-associated lymphoid tissue lymphoma translocation protein 1 homolog isoform X1 [Acropora millepora]
MDFLSYQIRKLPYGVLKKLADQLDVLDSTRNWKSLISVMPHTDSYTPLQVSAFERQGLRPGGSPAMALLNDLGQRCKTTKQLVVWLKEIENDDALEILGYVEEVEITEQPKSQPVRAGGSITLRCKAKGFPKPQYQWYKDDQLMQDGVDMELTIDHAEMKDSGMYKCIVSNQTETVKSNCVEVQVLPFAQNGLDAQRSLPPQAKHPPVIMQQPQSCYVPVGHPLSLSCEVVESPVAYQWYKDGFLLLGETGPVLEFQPFYYRHEGNYTCRVENSAGDALSNIATLEALLPNGYGPLDFHSAVHGRPAHLKQKATDKIALVIGNRDYVHLPLDESPLVHTCSDAKMLASILRKPEMGFKVISLMNLTRDEMTEALKKFYSLLGEGVYGLLYFAGHGFEQGGQNYLVPVDTGDWIPEKAVCAQKVLKEMNKFRTELIVFLLDICRKRANVDTSFTLECHDFPHDAQAVLGFATCPQSEAYERRQDPNGMYMKHLLKHITKDVKVEDVLHEVAGDVEAEVECNQWINRQRPQYHTTTTRSYSLCDQIAPDQSSEGRQKLWHEIHRLPHKREIEIDSGIWIELFFEHLNWLSNAVVLCLRVAELGEATMCEANLNYDSLPKDVQNIHFHQTTTNVLRQVVQNSPEAENGIVARAWRDGAGRESPSKCPVESISDIYNIQRLKQPLGLTITVKYVLNGSRVERTKHIVEVFHSKEFGIAAAFFND